MSQHPPFQKDPLLHLLFLYRPAWAARTKAALPKGIDLQFGIHFVSAKSRQNQTLSFTSWTAEKHTAYLPPAPSAAACWGRVAAVPEPQGDGLQRRRKLCCLAFLIAPLQGHWVVLEEQEQNTVCEMNIELKFKNSNTRSLPCYVLNVFPVSDLHVCHTQAKTKHI